MATRLDTANDLLVEKQERLGTQKEAMTELLTAMRTLYRDMDSADATSEAYYESMRNLRRLINTYGTGRFTKGRIQI